MAKAAFKPCASCRNPSACAKAGKCAAMKMSKGGTVKKAK